MRRAPTSRGRPGDQEAERQHEHEHRETEELVGVAPTDGDDQQRDQRRQRMEDAVTPRLATATA